MSNEFIEKCVKDFVSTVLLIDDQLESGQSATLPSEDNGILDQPVQGSAMSNDNITMTASLTSDDGKRKVYVTDLIKAFSKESLLVTPINPKEIGAKNKNDCMKILLGLANKSDVIILDWDMSVLLDSGDSFSGAELSNNIIEKLNSDNKYRLVIIYTADKEKDVKDNLPETSNIDIKIYGKSKTTGTIIKEYEELATQVNIDFLAGKKGLLGAALLSSLSALRKATYSMLETLNTDFDEALLYHRILLTNPDKITDFCSDIIKDEILSHLEDSTIEHFFDKKAFSEFIKTNNIALMVKETPDAEEADLAGNPEKLDAMLEKGYKSFFKANEQNLIANGDDLSLLIHNSKESIMQSFSYYSTMSFTNEKPYLKLGCIVKKDEDYYLCIQPPCDSERIPKLAPDGKCGNPRNFLFLKLEKNNKKISLYVKEKDGFQGVQLRYKMIETFMFAGDNKGFISLDDDGNYNTYSIDSQSICLHYICCLKPMFAQKIANNFAANISRVGIDQFEWLRLRGRE